MFTTKYKGFYIHGYVDRDECKVFLNRKGMSVFKSIHAAKCGVTRHLKGSL